MNVEEKCGCGSTIEIDEPTMQKPSAEVRDVLADFRVGHQCPHRSSRDSEHAGMMAVPTTMAAPPSGKGAPF